MEVTDFQFFDFFKVKSKFFLFYLKTIRIFFQEEKMGFLNKENMKNVYHHKHSSPDPLEKP